MAEYAILRFAKHKGGASNSLEAHHERQKEQYPSNPDIDITRSKQNFHIIHPVQKYRQEIDGRIKASGCRTRKDSTRLVDTLITASPEFFKNKSRSEVEVFFERATYFLSQQVGEDNIFSAVVHLDEKTPHLHLCFVPLTKDGRLSAKDILGNRVQMSKWQDDFHAYMSKSYPDLERGESARETGRQHIPTRIFKQAVHLTKQMEQLQDELSGINALNAGKKRDATLRLLETWFPEVEIFESQIRKYQKGFDYLKTENAALIQRATEDDSKKMEQRVKIAALQSQYQKLKCFVDAVPEDIKKQVKEMQNLKKQERKR